MTVLRYHAHEGVVGATATAAAEGYTTSAGTATYATGGAVGATSVLYPTGTVWHRDDVTGMPYLRMWVRWPGAASGNTTFARQTLATDATLGALRRTAAGALALMSGLAAQVDITTESFVVGDWYRTEWFVDGAAQECRLYNAAGALLDTLIGAAVAGSPARTHLGHPHAGASADPVQLDAVSLGDTWLGPGIPPSAPAVELAAHHTRAAIRPNLTVATIRPNLTKASL